VEFNHPDRIAAAIPPNKWEFKRGETDPEGIAYQ
jgi:hypothetical protein